MQSYNTSQLIHVALTYPAIDNHAHPLLKASYRDKILFEGLVSEAQGPALTQDAPHTLACYRATAQLSNVLRASGEQIPAVPTWEAIKEIRAKMDYERLCKIFMEPSRIQCILIDDGLGGSIEWAEAYRWHDQFTRSPTKRILRIEVLAEVILKSIFDAQLQENSMNPVLAHAHFIHRFTRALQTSATDPEVAGFKSIVCYRTGLNVELMKESPTVGHCITVVFLRYEATRTLRLSDKALNDYIVNVCLGIAATCGKPVQFHTGLGDNDITLTTSSPAVMQPLIKAFPNTKIVLLHSSYPYTREAGYLTAVYPNVFLDFGEIFPFVSYDGQAAVLRQVLELCPTNKILWSTDGHWWPESYYLGTQQAREVLWKVLAESVTKQDMTEAQAIAVVKGALFDNANRIYNLGLEPKWFSGM